jgi:glycosyltransferase involved in cell wall biosynthesis
MTTPRVSVLVPVHDAGTVLERALASVAAQTFVEHETIVVDDGSADAATRAALERAAGRPGVTVLRQANAGPAAARNAAAAAARGAYLLPLDADDWLEPGFLAATVPLLDEDPALDVVHTDVALEGGHVGTWRTGPFAIPALLVRCTVHVTTLLRATRWTTLGGQDPAFREGAEDWEFWIRAAAAGARGVGVPEALCHYVRGPRSRERQARSAETSGALLRRLVAKHDALYRAHLPEAFAQLYAEYAQVCDALERVYANPLVRTAVRVRTALGWGPRR